MRILSVHYTRADADRDRVVSVEAHASNECTYVWYASDRMWWRICGKRPLGRTMQYTLNKLLKEYHDAN